MQDQAMRLRLSELKKASIELKSKVYEQPRLDSQTVVEILSSVLPNNLKYNQSQLNSQKINTSQNNPTPKLTSNNQSLIYSPNNSSVIFPITNPQHKTEKGTRHSTNSSDASLPSKDVDRQIERFRQLNEQLQNLLANIDKQIADLRKIQETKQQQSWKQTLPFVRKQDKLGLFITKLSIRQYDFDKIDYESHLVKLSNDTLLIENARNFKKEFKMANLQQAKYIGDKCMKIQFKSDQIVSIFLQFAKTEHRNQWDHAFYINSKIITSKDLDKSLFIEEKEPVHSVKSKSKSSLKLSEASQNQNAKEDLRLKGSFRPTDRFVERSNASFASSRKKSEKSEEFKSITQLQYTLNGHSPDAFEQPPSNLNNSSFVSAGSKREKEIKDFVVFGEGISESSKFNESRPNTSKFNHGEVNFQQLEFTPNYFQQKKASESNVSQNDAKTNPTTKAQKQIQGLKQGFFFVKYAKDGYKPHNKKIFISSEQDVLICANSEDQNDRRVIPLEMIKTMKYPFIGDGIKKHIKNPRAENYCAIEYSVQGNPKCLELGCAKVHFIKRFYEYLSNFLKQRGILFTD